MALFGKSRKERARRRRQRRKDRREFRLQKREQKTERQAQRQSVRKDRIAAKEASGFYSPEAVQARSAAWGQAVPAVAQAAAGVVGGLTGGSIPDFDFGGTSGAAVAPSSASSASSATPSWIVPAVIGGVALVGVVLITMKKK